MAAKTGTYLVEFFDGTKIVCGNNYKWWYVHASEYALRVYRDKPRHEIVKSVKYSETRFYDDGGLKWAKPSHYQEVINEVSAEEGIAPIKFEDIKFEGSSTILKILDKEILSW